MANVNKSALISISCGKATGFSRIRFNLPEEMRYTFPVSDLFKMDIIGFNIEKIEFKKENNQNLIIMPSSVTRTKKLNAIFSFSVHLETYEKMQDLLSKETISQDEEDEVITQIKKVIESYPPIIQIVPKMNMQ